jgi:hypothetical protein
MSQGTDGASLPGDYSGTWVKLTSDLAELIDDLDVDLVEGVYLECLTRWSANQRHPELE